ncbi:trimeric intracellular cation channel family protein [Acidobacteria bacterium ACD]|nr:MAG: trimeric intracellular cation channel family protein [Acidobacteriota bacterium]MCE7959577.1 trimeric intracellular cation channel family protein [Acidobacteria bacterium ACB2]MDL1950498.1 trimeric intracellular cation channel family protein [Acidobacteria bacterium ACD]
MKDPTPALTVAIEAGAVLTSAVSGALKAAEKRADLVGTVSLALATAFGGGTLRDVLLQRRPFFWVSNQEYVVVTLVLGVVLVYSRSAYELARVFDRRAALVDALGLALFSLSGTRAGVEAGLSFLPASFMGVVTGTFGGVIRDVLVNDMPVIFRPGTLYAIPSLLGCWLYLGASALGAEPHLAGLAAVAAIVGVRMASVSTGLDLPPAHWNDGASGR